MWIVSVFAVHQASIGLLYQQRRFFSRDFPTVETREDCCCILPTCLGVRPGMSLFCLNSTWVSFLPLTVTAPISIASPTTMNGSVTINATVIFSSCLQLDSTTPCINATGCVNITGPTFVELNDNQLQTLLSKGSGQGVLWSSNCNTTLAPPLSLTIPPTCSSVYANSSIQSHGSGTSVLALFTVDSSAYQTPKSKWRIIVVATVGGVVALAILVLLAALYVPKVRTAVLPVRQGQYQRKQYIAASSPDS